MNFRKAAAIAGAAIMICTPLHAQDSAAGQGGQDLDQAANDPTASLMAFQLQGFYSPNLHNTNKDKSTVQFRAAIPFTAFGFNNIARLTLPFVTDNPFGNEGLDDTTLFNLVTFDRPWGRLGVGAIALLPTGGSTRSAEKWAAGPAAGFVAHNGDLLAGLFVQNLFSFAGDGDARADVDISNIQPIVNYSLGGGWSIGASEMNGIFDWNNGEFTSLPLGLKLSKLAHVGGAPVQVQLSYEHDFYDKGFGEEDTIGLTFKLLVPK